MLNVAIEYTMNYLTTVLNLGHKPAESRIRS
jgi:hypothetical protein